VLKREQKEDNTHIDLIECVPSRKIAEHPRLVEIDQLGHIVDAPEVGLRVPRQHLPPIDHGLTRPPPYGQAIQ
jgi:hypothetical protein